MDLFDYMREQNMEKEAPLASRLRPTTLEEVVGQQHIIGKDKLLYRAIKADKLSSVIFYGPPGTGKTTLAKVIANTTSAEFTQINATTAGKKDMEEVIAKAKEMQGMYRKKTILFVDEIHRFNKGQQDYLLPFVPAPPPRPHVAVRVPPPSRGSAPAARSDAAPMPPSPPRLLRRGRTHRPPAPPPQPHLPMHSGMRTCPRRVLGCSAAARCSRNAFPGVWRWQDCALMHSQRDLGQEKRRFVAAYRRHASKMSWFWQEMRAVYPKSPANRCWRIHQVEILPRAGVFPVRDPQIMHSA